MELKQMTGRNYTQQTGVLIVPYGIETHLKVDALLAIWRVNCTLWN